MAHYLVIRCDTNNEMKEFMAGMLMELIGYKLGDIEDVAFTLDSMQEFINIGNIAVLVKEEE